MPNSMNLQPRYDRRIDTRVLSGYDDDRVYFDFDFDSLDNYYVYTEDNAYVEWYSGEVEVGSYGAEPNIAALTKVSNFMPKLISYQYPMKFRVMMNIYSNPNLHGEMLFGIGDPYQPVFFAYKYLDGTIFGYLQESSNIYTVPLHTFEPGYLYEAHLFEAIWDPIEGAKFYIDDLLKGQITDPDISLTNYSLNPLYTLTRGTSSGENVELAYSKFQVLIG